MAKKVFLIAGEPSGDALGAGLMRELKAHSDEPVEFVGIGGDLMQAEGLDTLLPMEELCVMGVWEVLTHLPRLMRLINGMVEEVEKAQPDVVITIDLPDFNFRVASRLKKRESTAKLIHYVAPSVWAWRPKRAQKIAKFLDGLICLFPFEPPYFDKHDLPACFVGHPLVEKNLDEVDPAAFRVEYDIDPDDTVLGVFLGSRMAELKKMGETLKDTTDVLLEQHPDLTILVPTLPHLEFEVRSIIQHWKGDPIIVTSLEKKYSAFAACDVALAVSGTVGLELAYLGVPHIIGYKAHPATHILVKMLIKIKYAHLANILLDDAVVPEYLQHKCTPLDMSKGLLKMLKFDEEKTAQTEAFETLRTMMKVDATKQPSRKAAEFVFDILAGTYVPEPLPVRAPKAVEPSDHSPEVASAENGKTPQQKARLSRGLKGGAQNKENDNKDALHLDVDSQKQGDKIDGGDHSINNPSSDTASDAPIPAAEQEVEGVSLPALIAQFKARINAVKGRVERYLEERKNAK